MRVGQGPRPAIRWRWSVLAGAVLCLVLVATAAGLSLTGAARLSPRGPYTVAERVKQYGPAARQRWTPYFEKARVAYPPQRVVLAVFKSSYRMEVYAASRWYRRLVHLRTLGIRGASGELGPKLREGDMQVPEGFYEIDLMNPSSAYHLSMRLNYPNAFDRKMGKREGRKQLGGLIMIHGDQFSSGCLAMGNQVAEDLFILVAETGMDDVRVILSPVDFRTSRYRPKAAKPWVSDLYDQLRRALEKLPAPRGTP